MQRSTVGNRGNTGVVFLVALVVILILCTIGWWICVEVDTVGGNEVGVMETWSDGVDTKIYPSKTYWLFPNWSKDMYRYSLQPQIFVMNDRKNDERANGRPNDAYRAHSSDNQTLILDLALQWHYDQGKIIDIHKRYKTHVGVKGWDQVIEERVIRQNLMAAVNTEVTARKAIDVYSGDGFIATQKGIENKLQDVKGELRSQGIIVESFVIEKILFEDQNYINEINGRQVAQQKEQRAQAEEKAALAVAQRVKAEAQADYEKQVVEARREKEKVVLESQGAAEKQVNEATAAASRVTIAAKAEQDAAEARAAAIKAIGAAEAEAQRLRMAAYSGPGADSYVKIKVSEQMAAAFGGIKGYMPSDMKINMLTTNFMESLERMMGTHAPAPVK